MPNDEKKFELSVELIPSEDLRPIWGNYFKFTRLADNFILDVGYIDPQQVVDLQEKYPDGNIPKGENKIKANITLKIGMSTDTFLRLKENLEEIYEKSVAAGAIPRKEV